MCLTQRRCSSSSGSVRLSQRNIHHCGWCGCNVCRHEYIFLMQTVPVSALTAASTAGSHPSGTDLMRTPFPSAHSFKYCSALWLACGDTMGPGCTPGPVHSSPPPVFTALSPRDALVKGSIWLPEIEHGHNFGDPVKGMGGPGQGGGYPLPYRN